MRCPHCLNDFQAKDQDDDRLATTTCSALTSILEERRRQTEKWGEQNHTLGNWGLILMEEVGEWSEAALHTQFGGPKAAGLREEAVQVAAVALQIVQWLDKQNCHHEWSDGCMVRDEGRGKQWRLQFCKCGESRVKPGSELLLQNASGQPTAGETTPTKQSNE